MATKSTIALDDDRTLVERQMTRAYAAVPWKRGLLFPLRLLFNRLRFGDLESRLVQAASQGNTPAVLDWLRRGADIHADGDSALRAALRGSHFNTASALLYAGADHRQLSNSDPSRSPA